MSDQASLPVRDIVAEVYGFLWASRRDLLAMATLPVLILSIVGTLLGALFPQTQDAGNAEPASFGMMIASLIVLCVSVALYVMFAVAWHRRCLKPEEQTTIWEALRWDPRKTQFLLRSIVIGAVSLAVALPIGVIVSILAGTTAVITAAGGTEGQTVPAFLGAVMLVLIIIPVLLVNARIALWLPSTALGERLTLLETWKIGHRNSWRLLSAVLLASIPAALIFGAVKSLITLLTTGTGVADSLTFSLLSAIPLYFADYIVIATGVTAISFTYRYLRRRPLSGGPYYLEA